MAFFSTSRHGWLSDVAAIGCLIAIGWIHAETVGHARAQEPVGNQAEQESKRDVDAEKADFDSEFWRSHVGDDPQTYRDICQDPKDRDYADLCQQWRTAEATIETAKWARPQFIASVATVFGLILTIFVSIMATVITGRAARAAGAQVKEMRRQFDATHRPLIVVRVGIRNIHLQSTPVEVRCVAANSGATDARIVQTACVILNTDYVLPGALNMVPIVPTDEQSTIAPGSAFRWDAHSESIFPAEFDGYERMGWRIFCVGFVVYLDKNGARRQMGFCRVYNRKTQRFDPTNDPDYEYSY